MSFRVNYFLKAINKNAIRKPIYKTGPNKPIELYISSPRAINAPNNNININKRNKNKIDFI